MKTLKRTFFGLILGSLVGISLLGLKLAVMPNLAMAQGAIELTDSTITSSNSDVEATIGSLIQIALGFLGVISVVIILMGGFKWMVSSGNNDNINTTASNSIHHNTHTKTRTSNSTSTSTNMDISTSIITRSF